MISKQKRFYILKRDSFTCRYCGGKAPDVALEVDHVIPRSSGGSDDDANLATSCWDCNIGKSDRLLSDLGRSPLRFKSGPVRSNGRPVMEEGRPRNVYLDELTWSWLSRQKYGASDAVRELIAHKIAAEAAGAKA